MSLYTDAVKTHVIDPVRDITGRRTEFRLSNCDEAVYLSNMRLMNLGVITDINGSYNSLTGCYGIIQQITLFDGSTLLDQVLSAQSLLGFKLYNRSNDKARDQSRYLAKNGLGFTFTNIDYGDVGNINNEARSIDYYTPAEAKTGTGTTVFDTNKGWLSLREIFPLLSELNYVPTGLFKNLRVVVQYDLTSDQVTPGGTVTVTVLAQTEPLLVVDQLVDPVLSASITSSFTNVNYRSIEHDRAVVNSITPTAANPNPEQVSNFTVNGFDNKTVNRIVIVNTPKSTVSQFTGTHHSVSQLNQKLQVRVNGANKIPRSGDGWNRPNQRLARLTDTWGECVTTPGSNDLNVNNSSNIASELTNDLIGNMDYTGIVIGEKVNELQLSYTRTGQFNTAVAPADQNTQSLNESIELNIYGEVEKSLTVKGDRYNVSYV